MFHPRNDPVHDSAKLSDICVDRITIRTLLPSQPCLPSNLFSFLTSFTLIRSVVRYLLSHIRPASRFSTDSFVIRLASPSAL